MALKRAPDRNERAGQEQCAGAPWSKPDGRCREQRKRRVDEHPGNAPRSHASARTNANHDAASRREKMTTASISVRLEICRTRAMFRAEVTTSGTMAIADRTLDKKRICQLVQ